MTRLSLRGKVMWTVGNLLMLLGLYLLLYVGGLYADEQYNLLAAQGGSDIALPETISAPSEVGGEAPAPAELAARVFNGKDSAIEGFDAQQPASTGLAAGVSSGEDPAVEGFDTEQPAAAAPRPGFRLPRLNSTGDGRELNTVAPSSVANFGQSTITRILIPRINLDRKVIPVGITFEEQNGQRVAVWEVAKYAVGHHKGTANPLQPGNIVMAGHSGGRAYPFNDIFYLGEGDAIVLESNGELYEYKVTQRLVLDEIGMPMSHRRENARWIEPTEEEVVTLVTCWPLTGPNKFTQRVVVRAAPLHAPFMPDEPDKPMGGWTAR